VPFGRTKTVLQAMGSLAYQALQNGDSVGCEYPPRYLVKDDLVENSAES